LPRADLPSGTVTFLFTDVEGSTRLLHELGADGYAEALAEHRRVIREACAVEGGVEVDTQGDAFFFAFPTAPGALTAAAAFAESLSSGPIQVRVGLHTGTPLVTEEGYIGDDVHFAARVAASSHGGQVVLSAAMAPLLEPSDTVSQGFELLDLGEHRLKDIAEPVSIFQLGDGSFPPLKTISNTNLPRPASSFVGRETELAEVLSRIEGGARLLTLTGPGGSGKTRLAVEAAASLVPEYKAGVFWVGLSALRDPALVTETIAQTLGAKDGLQEHIGERELLLLLDNLEQVVDAAPELASLLERCPNLALLCTSRELLRVRGEVEYPVPALASPEAVTLFCARSGLAPSEELAELCARLDNLPLAVELAAARTKALTVHQILERLSQRLELVKGGRDADPRQQTLRATIEWSYDLLTKGEEALFRRLAVFAGGCTLEAAEEVAAADLDTLQSLVEKSLLRFSEDRYWMLETIREYAAEQLTATDASGATRRLHAAYFAPLAEMLDDLLLGGAELQRARGILRVETENLRSTLAWAVENEADTAYRLTALLDRYWYSAGLYEESLLWCERVLGLPAGDRVVERQKLLQRIAETQSMWGNYDRAREALSESLELVWGLGDPALFASCCLFLGHLAGYEGDWDEAQRFYEDAVTTFEASGDLYDLILGRLNLGWALVNKRALEHARSVLTVALEDARGAGSTELEAVILNNLAHVALGEDRFSELEELAKGAFGLAADLQAKRLVEESLELLARPAAARGDDLRAATLAGAAARLRDELGIPEVTGRGDLLEASRDRLGAAAWDTAFERGMAMESADVALLAHP